MSIERTLRSSPPAEISRPTRVLEAVARRAVHARLERLATGRIVIREPNAESSFGLDDTPAIVVHVRSPRIYTRILFEGSLGAGRSWIDGDWAC